MGKNYLSFPMYECGNCFTTYEEVQDAEGCCVRIQEIGHHSCEVCKKKFKDNEKGAEKCCSDELIEVIKKAGEDDETK